MARKRLRTFLDAVISDDDLRTSVERVADAPAPADPGLIVVQPEADEPAPPAAADAPLSAPPWENPPALAALPAAETAPAGNGNAAAHAPVTVDLAGAAALVVSQPVSDDLVVAQPVPDQGVPSEPAPPTPVELAHRPAPEQPAAQRDDDAPATVLLGAAAEAGHAGRRRRRSATPLPPLPSPADVPEDAAGRVAIFAVPGPATAPPPDGDRARHAPDVTPAPVVPVGGDAPLAGWLPVLALGVVLVVVFVIGVLVTR